MRCSCRANTRPSRHSLSCPAARSRAVSRRLHQASARSPSAAAGSPTCDSVATHRRSSSTQAGGGADLVYGPVGCTKSEDALRSLRADGQLLVIGFASGAIPTFAANQILLRNRSVTGVEWGSWAAREAEANDAMLREVMARIERG